MSRATSRRVRALPRFPLLAVMAVGGLVLVAPACKRQKPPSMARIWLGAFHGCATLTSGELECWGAGDHDQLGNGEKAQSLTPVHASDAFHGPKDLALGRSHTCGVYEDGHVACWGRIKAPALPPGAKATQIAAAGDRTCAIVDGRVLCWDAAHPAPSAPVGLVLASEKAALLAVGNDRVCASVSAGAAGSGDAGAGAAGDAGAAGGPARVVRCVNNTGGAARNLLEGAGVTMLTAGAGHACALLDDGSARCWGDNTRGQLGDGTTTASVEPVLVSGLPRALEIRAGAQFTCARLHDGTVACWGDNEHHQLANGGTQSVSRPAPVQGLTGVLELTVGATSACGRVPEYGARCWGDNKAGQLGDGSTTEHDVPMPVRSPTHHHRG